MKVAMWEGDLSDDYLKWASQIGVDGIDIHNPYNIPGVKEQGYPDMNKLLAFRNRILSKGLKIFRVTLPSVQRFLKGEVGGDEEVDNMCKTIECLGKASIPIGRPIFSIAPPMMTTHMAKHRGGYTQRAYDLKLMKKHIREKKIEKKISFYQEHWSLTIQVYKKIVPVAEDYDIRLALHPSDPPLPEAPFSYLGIHKVLDAVPSPNNGLLYCVGTRYEAGGTSLVLNEIRHFGRKKKIFEVHFRNVRGNLATSRGFEEVALDDGDMNMFTIIKALHKVGFDGPLNPDHIPHLINDTSYRRMAWSYTVGYVKALLAALNESS